MAGRRQVALIRGINVGKAKRVAMADLRALMERQGHSDVRTLLNSGNVVYSSKQPAARAAVALERGLAEKLEVPARVTALEAADFARAAEQHPLAAMAWDLSRLMVAFLMGAGDRRRLTPLVGQDWYPEALALGRGVAYLWCPDGILDSSLMKAIEGARGDGVTIRNWATVGKIAALL